MLYECFIDAHEDFAKSYRKCNAWMVVLTAYIFIMISLIIGGIIGMVYVKDLLSATVFSVGAVLMFPVLAYMVMVSVGYCLARAYSLPS